MILEWWGMVFLQAGAAHAPGVWRPCGAVLWLLLWVGFDEDWWDPNHYPRKRNSITGNSNFGLRRLVRIQQPLAF